MEYEDYIHQFNLNLHEYIMDYNLRPGQCVFHAAYDTCPELVDQIIGGSTKTIDPFYDDSKIDDFMEEFECKLKETYKSC